MTTNTHSWMTIDFSKLPQNDSLLACLVMMSRYYQHPRSAKTLSARLPLDNNCLTLELLPRAAARAGLNTDFVECKWKEIKPEMLPAIATTKDGKASILIADENNTIKVVVPGKEEPLQDTADFEKVYSGQLICLEPEYQFSTRADETLGKDKRNWFWPVFFKSWPIYIEVIVASILINTFVIVIPLFVMNVYDRVVPNEAIATLWVLASGVFVVFFFDFILKTLRTYFLEVAKKRTDNDLSASIFSHVMGVNMTERPKSVGSLANIVQSFESFRDFITASTISLCIDLPFVFLFILVIYWIGGPLFMVPLIVVPVILIVGLLIQFPLVSLTKRGYKLMAEKQAILFESLHNVETVKTSGAEAGLQGRWENIVQLISENSAKLSKWTTLSTNISVMAQQSATIFVVIWGVYLIAEREITLGALIACTIITGRAIAPMTQIANLFTRYYQSVNAMRGIDRIMQLNTDITDEANYLHRATLHGNIEFKNVSFHYGEDETPILDNVNLSFSSGERVAIIGRIGSGKSSLARILLQLYVPSKGTITIDGTDYRQINPDDLRQQIGYVPQDISLLYGSVRENITISAPFVDDKRLIEVCNIANIGLFTNKHPLGLDRSVGERGSELSGGQRQSIAIARALLLDPKILIFDEPTSNMDDNSERLLKKNIKSYLTEDHTFILITHKFSMLELADRVIVLDDGKVVADGPKDSVISALKSGMTIHKKEK